MQLVGQPLEGIFVGDGAFTCGDDDEEMVFGDVGGELREFVPMAHGREFSAYGGMVGVDKAGDEIQRLTPSVELYAAVELASKTAEPFQPAVETRLELSPAGHGHLYAAQGGEGLYQAGE